MRRLIITLIFLLILIQSVHAIGVYIRPPSMIFRPDIKSNVITTIDSSVEVKNPNDYPVVITPSAAGPIELLDDQPFALQVDELRNINFTIAISRWGNYYGKVSARFSAEHHLPYTISSDITIRAMTNETGINNDPPTKPQLLLPTNNSMQGNAITLSWEASQDSDGNKLMYYYYIDDNDDFSSPESSGWRLKTEKKINLANGGTYYWKITAFDGLYEVSSGLWQFSINQVPPVPTLLSPGDKAYLETDPVLVWNNVTDPNGDEVDYELIVYDANLSIILNENLLSNFYDTNSINLQSGKYYWAVRSSDELVKSEYSDVWNFLLCKDNSSEYCTGIMINSPVSKTYDNRKILIDVETGKTVKHIYRALNSNRFYRECSDCNSFSKTLYGKEGLNQLVIRTVDYEDYEINKIIEFFIDTRKPYILRTNPGNRMYVNGLANFTVMYMEENLRNISIVYGNETSVKEILLSNCPSGRRAECSAIVDLSEYDGQEIESYFIVRDDIHSENSKISTITVDAIPPLVTIESPGFMDYDNRRIDLVINVSEVVDIEKSENGKKFRRICSRCNYYNRIASYRDGFYNLTIRATDKAGNEGYANVTFFVDSTQPRIVKTTPKDKSYVKGMANFTVVYTEDYLRNISVVYGNETLTKEKTINCPSGRNKECSIIVNVSEFNDQTIDYYFVLRDKLHTVFSKTGTVTVDAVPPVVTLYSPQNQTYEDRMINIEVEVSEKVGLEHSYYGRFRSLCKNCDYRNKKLYYRKGSHDLLIRATDKAGNEGYASVSFSIA